MPCGSTARRLGQPFKVQLELDRAEREARAVLRQCLVVNLMELAPVSAKIPCNT